MTTQHDNYAYIEGEDIQSISYLPNTAMVSDGQPMETPPEIRSEGNQFIIILKAGRKKKDKVAEKFIGNSGGSGHMFSPFALKDKQPKELNFLFGLKIHWKNGETVDVYLGQGSTVSRNNWWMGSKSISAENGRATINVGNEKYRLTGYDDKISAAEMSEEVGTAEVGAQAAIPPALIPILVGLGQALAEQIAKLITANVNSFRITK